MKLNKQQRLRILFIGKADDLFSRQAAEFILTHYPSAKIIYSARQQPFPQELLSWKGDLIISYLSQWIIPQILLQRAAIAAINFHPGPPEYPGIGCTNFAIYNGADEFGVTCHHMVSKVDTGDIIAVKRFPVYCAGRISWRESGPSREMLQPRRSHAFPKTLLLSPRCLTFDQLGSSRRLPLRVSFRNGPNRR